jgi:hypothetical protein
VVQAFLLLFIFFEIIEILGIFGFLSTSSIEDIVQTGFFFESLLTLPLEKIPQPRHSRIQSEIQVFLIILHISLDGTLSIGFRAKHTQSLGLFFIQLPMGDLLLPEKSNFLERIEFLESKAYVIDVDREVDGWNVGDFFADIYDYFLFLEIGLVDCLDFIVLVLSDIVFELCDESIEVPFLDSLEKLGGLFELLYFLCI